MRSGSSSCLFTLEVHICLLGTAQNRLIKTASPPSCNFDYLLEQLVKLQQLITGQDNCLGILFHYSFQGFH